MRNVAIIMVMLFALTMAGQTYKDLPIKKIWNVSMEADSSNGKNVFKIEGKDVDKAAYYKYHNAWKDMMNCKPCMVETYSADNKLLYKAVKYTDCPVGEWTSYYPSGKVKEKGMYRENESGNWDDLWNTGYCIKHGTWTYYSESGAVQKTEKYNFGNLQENK